MPDANDKLYLYEALELRAEYDARIKDLNDCLATVTENWADFQREIRRAEADGLDHYGVLFTSARQMSRSRKAIGLFVRVLDDFLGRHPAEDALMNSYRWLPDEALRRTRRRGISRPGRDSLP